MTFPDNPSKEWREHCRTKKNEEIARQTNIDIEFKPDSSTDEEDTKKGLKEQYFNMRMCANYGYMLLCFNTLGACIGTSVIYVHLSAYSLTLGQSDYRSALLYSTIGGCNIFGRLIFGAAAKVPKLSALVLHTFAFTVAGVATILLPVSDSYAWMQFYAAVFGLMTSTLGPLVPVAIVDFLGPALMANGYGNLMLFEAIGVTLGGPLAGKTRNMCELYQTS